MSTILDMPSEVLQYILSALVLAEHYPTMACEYSWGRKRERIQGYPELHRFMKSVNILRTTCKDFNAALVECSPLRITRLSLLNQRNNTHGYNRMFMFLRYNNSRTEEDYIRKWSAEPATCPGEIAYRAAHPTSGPKEVDDAMMLDGSLRSRCGDMCWSQGMPLTMTDEEAALTSHRFVMRKVCHKRLNMRLAIMAEEKKNACDLYKMWKNRADQAGAKADALIATRAMY
jgi:hypothetical protein